MAPPDPPAADPAPPRRSSRVKQPPTRLGNFARETKVDDAVEAPKTWKQLLKSPHKKQWLKAAEDEMMSLMGMDTWRLVPQPARHQIIKSKWIFKVKRKVDKTILKLKARLVAMGYSQVKGEDYDEVFAPTLRMETLRLMFSLLASKKWVGRQLDFKTAFLNGSLDETIYMEQPPGFEDPEHPYWVCELLRSLYGLEQSPRQWNKALHTALIRLGLTQSKYNPTLYFQIENGKIVGALTTHVDDLAIIGESAFTTRVTSDLSKCFEVSSDEELHHFLSLKITRDIPNQLLYLSQEHYINEMSARFVRTPIKVSTPTDSFFKDLAARSSSETPSPGNYASIVGALLWVAQCTRSDVAFAVNQLSQFLRDPSESHWLAAIRVLNYLASTKALRLQLGGDLLCSGYSDSDWAEDKQTRHSTSGYTYRVGIGAISWKSRKQRTISLSSTEAKYKAMSVSTKEALWLKHLLTELHLRPQDSIPLHVDNEGAEALAQNPSHHSRTKHIHARYHFIRECIEAGDVRVLHVSTKDMLADMLTKPLARVLLERHRGMFGIV